MYISASAPDALPLSETTIGCFINWFPDRGLHHPRHLVGGTAGTRGDDDFHRLVGSPGGGGRGGGKRHCERRRAANADLRQRRSWRSP
jgi:hypothetical protein